MARRRLCYGDRYTQYLTNTITENTEGDSIENDVVLPLSERVPLVLEISGGEYSDLLSAAMAGSDLLFNDIAHQITWLLWKAGKVELCAAVANCILNTPEVQGAIQGVLAGGGGSMAGNPTSPIPISERERNLLPDDYICDENHRFGMAYAIVDALHEATREVFEAIEILTNPVELAAEISDNVPLWGTATTALDIIAWIQETAYEAYTLAWSTTVRDSLACELRCAMIATGECELSYNTILDVYTSISGVDVPDFGEWVEWALFIITIPLTIPDVVVKACSLMGLGAMAFGSRVGPFKLGIRSLETVVALAADETNSDHSILCDPCAPEWCHTDYPVLGDPLGWVKWVNSGAGVLTATGWQHEDIVSGTERRRSVYVYKEFDSRDLSNIRITADFTLGTWDNYDLPAVNLLIRDSGAFTTVFTRNASEIVGGIDVTYDWENVSGLTADAVLVFMRSSRDTVSPYQFSGSIMLKSIELCGYGTCPAQICT